MPTILQDGFATLEGGMNGGIDADLIDSNQCAKAINYTFRGGFAKPRPRLTTLPLTFSDNTTQAHWSGKFQGALFYQAPSQTDESILLFIGGKFFRIKFGTTNRVDELSFNVSQAIPASYDFIHLFQAENYVIGMIGKYLPIIFDGGSARQSGINEIPPGLLGIYVNGRIWVVLPDRSTLLAGDLVYSSSGTAQLGYVDALLKFTETNYANEGGAFSVPKSLGRVTSLNTLATTDTSLGMGSLLVGAEGGITSINVPIDRTQWKNLSYPPQTIALIGYGPASPRASIGVNSDFWYRSSDGYHSFIAARRDFNSLSSTPMSREISPVLDQDDPSLLFYGSAVNFGNRYISTQRPLRTDYGVIHKGLATINFDLVSNLKGKQAPAWDGLWTGLNTLQILKGTVAGVERCFVLALNNSNIVELWELLPDDSSSYDNYVTVSGLNTTITRYPVQCVLQSKSLDCKAPTQLKYLNMAAIYLDEITDDVTLVIKYKPDQYPNWTTWGTLQLCANVSQCTVPANPDKFNCVIIKEKAKQYAARLTLPTPDYVCNTITGKAMNLGYDFQVQLEQTGTARIRKFLVFTNPQTDETEGSCPPSQATCTTVESCGDAWYDYDINNALP